MEKILTNVIKRNTFNKLAESIHLNRRF